MKKVWYVIGMSDVRITGMNDGGRGGRRKEGGEGREEGGEGV